MAIKKTFSTIYGNYGLRPSLDQHVAPETVDPALITRTMVSSDDEGKSLVTRVQESQLLRVTRQVVAWEHTA